MFVCALSKPDIFATKNMAASATVLAPSLSDELNGGDKLSLSSAKVRDKLSLSRATKRRESRARAVAYGAATSAPGTSSAPDTVYQPSWTPTGQTGTRRSANQRNSLHSVADVVKEEVDLEDELETPRRRSRSERTSSSRQSRHERAPTRAPSGTQSDLAGPSRRQNTDQEISVDGKCRPSIASSDEMTSYPLTSGRLRSPKSASDHKVVREFTFTGYDIMTDG